MNPLTGLISCFSFNDVVQILDPSVHDFYRTFAFGLQLRNGNAISRSRVGVEKAFGRFGIAGRGQIKIDRVAEFVDGPVKIRPLSADFHIGFINAPTR